MGKERPTTKQIAKAVARRAGSAELTRILVDELPGSELASLLLHVMRERSRSVTWADALRLVERNGLVRADTADARVLTELDARAFAAAEGFDAVELSPVAPFGVNALTGIDQNNVLTATRGTEVLADPTIAMALECASRRKREGRAGLLTGAPGTEFLYRVFRPGPL
ncbi:hypothetical protein [Archangium violaceum]|uniref:Uncharacterized protein n=1 Tax=Archangium violaceum Cb vi76 TaxID=1406225 RepID=A0A084SKN3_9BACT|nr:hypothetical protein [Archangium violaceum]KFA89018.1 hypothetical protein Q664_37510 [Archangium violaceum Cb vi76]